ncbi:MAG: hypothetical protein WC360_06130 [Opitutales bacterium]|jgi:hypothetical protein
MSDQEYYVRNPDSENARGPFSLDKLQSLSEAGQIDRQSLYYDDQTESWRLVGDSAVLCAALFPEKKKLTLRRRGAQPPPQPPVAAPLATEAADGEAAQAVKPPPPAPVQEEAPAALPEPVHERSGIEVEDLLSAAEGHTDEMELLRVQHMWRDRAVALSLPMMAFLMLLSALSLFAGDWKAIWDCAKVPLAANWAGLAEKPMNLLGLLDLFFAMLLALAVTRAYQPLRLRLMLGLGFLGYSAYAAWTAGSAESGLSLLALILFSVGVYVSTLTIRFSLLLFSGVCALAGVAGYGILRVFPGILS